MYYLGLRDGVNGNNDDNQDNLDGAVESDVGGAVVAVLMVIMTTVLIKRKTAI